MNVVKFFQMKMNCMINIFGLTTGPVCVILNIQDVILNPVTIPIPLISGMWPVITVGHTI